MQAVASELSRVCSSLLFTASIIVFEAGRIFQRFFQKNVDGRVRFAGFDDVVGVACLDGVTVVDALSLSAVVLVRLMEVVLVDVLSDVPLSDVALAGVGRDGLNEVSAVDLSVVAVVGVVGIVSVDDAFEVMSVVVIWCAGSVEGW